jgi:prepilin-type N-terminal cleavage/methylation domain-containing protein/prepilin-type processing-associated H-X9-DG protein
MTYVVHQRARARCRDRAAASGRRGFTLVELLVVIGIVAVLLGVLLAAMSHAREAGRSVQCLSNLRTLDLAMISYVQKYGRFPRSGLNTHSEDWFHFTNTGPHKRKGGGIAEFLSDGGPTTSPVWICPSDDPDTHLMRAPDGGVAYPFSYAVNGIICTYFHIQNSGVGRLNQWPVMLEGNDWCARSLSLAQVRQPESKIILIDESSEASDDGCWTWQWDAGMGRNMLSNRHDRRKEATRDVNAGYGNAAFVDGHAERIARVKTLDPKHYDPFYPGESLLPPSTVRQTP